MEDTREQTFIPLNWFFGIELFLAGTWKVYSITDSLIYERGGVIVGEDWRYRKDNKESWDNEEWGRSTRVELTAEFSGHGGWLPFPPSSRGGLTADAIATLTEPMFSHLSLSLPLSLSLFLSLTTNYAIK